MSGGHFILKTFPSESSHLRYNWGTRVGGIGIPPPNFRFMGCSSSCRMAPRKGQGKSKGKQPALQKSAAKRPPPEISSSEDEAEGFDRQRIVQKIAALEQAKGFCPPAQPVPQKKGRRVTRQEANRVLQSEGLNRLSLLEGAGGADTMAEGEAETAATAGGTWEQHGTPDMGTSSSSGLAADGKTCQGLQMGQVWPWGHGVQQLTSSTDLRRTTHK